jgi:hypothetical protein
MLFPRHEFALDLLLKMLKKVEDNSHPPQEQLRVIASFVRMMIDELRGAPLTMDVQALSASRQAGHVVTIHARANEALSKIRYRVFYRLRPLAGEPFDTPAELPAEELVAPSQSDSFSPTRKCAGCGLRYVGSNVPSFGSC